MKDHLDHIAFFRDLRPEQAERLARVIASDPDAARLFRLWRDLRDDLAQQLDEAVGSRELFVLFVMREYGDSSLLTDAERSRVDHAAPRLRKALADHPGWSGAADDIQRTCRHFEAVWGEYFGADEAMNRQDRRTEPSSRDTDERPTIRSERIDGARTKRARSDRIDRARTERVRSDRSAREPRSRTARWAARLAIGTAVVAFAALLVFMLQRDHGMMTVATAPGETRVVELGAGSTVRLLGDSRVSFTPPDDAAPIGRQVVFEGHGFFEVVPDGHGLVVKTDMAQVTVLGTSFGLQSRDGATEVVLAQGRLSFAPLRDPARSVVLESGQMSRVDAGGVPTPPQEVSVHERLAWTGLFVFASAPLGSILEELQEHYGVALSASKELLSERVTGRFDQDQELVQVLETIASAVQAEVQETPPAGYRLAAR